MKTIRELTIRIDGVSYRSTKAPESIDEMDGHCPACGDTVYFEVVTIIQRGFAEDDCLTVMTCSACYESFHYQYKIDSPAVLTPWPMDFS